MERLQCVRSQVGRTLVVDNGSGDDTSGYVKSAGAIPGVTLIRNNTNRGLAAALNQGVQWAGDQGYAWILLLDQDTVLWPTTLGKLIQAYTEFPEKQRLGVLGCNRFLKDAAPGTKWWTEARAVITSGSLVSLAAVRAAGNFREEFFIDCVDFEFCLRARSRGFAVVEILKPIMSHSIGNPKPARLLWIQGRTANHRPWRWYYMTRNNTIVIVEYLWKEPSWVVRAGLTLAYTLTLSLIFDESRWRRLKYAILGLLDAVFRRFDRVII
jgi:rhamnosyltransferase